MREAMYGSWCCMGMRACCLTTPPAATQAPGARDARSMLGRELSRAASTPEMAALEDAEEATRLRAPLPARRPLSLKFLLFAFAARSVCIWIRPHVLQRHSSSRMSPHAQSLSCLPALPFALAFPKWPTSAGQTGAARTSHKAVVADIARSLTNSPPGPTSSACSLCCAIQSQGGVMPCGSAEQSRGGGRSEGNRRGFLLGGVSMGERRGNFFDKGCKKGPPAPGAGTRQGQLNGQLHRQRHRAVACAAPGA